MSFFPPRFIPPLAWKKKTTPRDAALAAWRGLNVAEQEKAFKNTAKPAGDILPGVLKSIGLDRKRSELEIVRVWDNLIDPVIVQHARPAGLHKGTLFIDVDSNVWLDELVRYRRREILLRLQHSFGPDLIQRLSFRVG